MPNLPPRSKQHGDDSRRYSHSGFLVGYDQQQFFQFLMRCPLFRVNMFFDHDLVIVLRKCRPNEPSTLDWRFPKIAVLFGGPQNTRHNILGYSRGTSSLGRPKIYSKVFRWLASDLNLARPEPSKALIPPRPRKTLMPFGAKRSRIRKTPETTKAPKP